MANVVGTTCSIGSIIFNFPNDFQGTASVINQGAPTVNLPITPAAVGFIPLQSGDQAGFQLIFNFTDGPGASAGSSASHALRFSYTIQAAPGTEVRAQNLAMDASVQGAPAASAVVRVREVQAFAFTDSIAETDLDNEQNVLATNVLSNNVLLGVPSFQSSFFGLPTTQISDSSTGGASASLASATFSYTTGPVIPPPRLAPLKYTNIDLPGEVQTAVFGINNQGTIIGGFIDPAFNAHGYTQDPNGSITTFDVPGASAGTIGFSINDRGDIVGSFQNMIGDAFGLPQGFLLPKGGNFITFDFPGANNTQPFFINNQGQIVGEYLFGINESAGFLLDNGVFSNVDFSLNGAQVTSLGAVGINNSAEIVGFFIDPQTFRSFLKRSDRVNFIDVPGQGETIIGGINDRGDTVGTYSDVNGINHGFVLAGGTFQTVDFPGGSDTIPFAINNSGLIVGVYTTADFNQHSFLAQPTADDGQDHQPDTSSANPNQPKPDCRDPQWQSLRRPQPGGCRFKQ
jgi:hypothetical protein